MIANAVPLDSIHAFSPNPNHYEGEEEVRAAK
jgi:hypothetical protein